jgi:mRNA-degrading endonuclease RelE of RelBE toxin-antitoxin system
LKIKAYKSFQKTYKVLPQNIQAKVDKQIEILEQNYLHPSLHTKKIKGKEGIRCDESLIDFALLFVI